MKDTIFFLSICCIFSISIMANNKDEIYINHRIDRLNKHVSFLAKFHAKNKEQIKILTKEIKKALWRLDITKYDHELIRLCVKKVLYTRAINPIFEAWRLFLETYRSIDSTLFLREFSILIFCLYKNFIFSLDRQGHVNPKVSSVEIFELSGRIMSLPIDQILDALDVCYHQFIFIMQDYGMTTIASPTEWIKENWWVIPVSFVSLIVSIAKYCIMRPFWGQMHNLPRETPELDQGSSAEEEESVDESFEQSPAG